MAFAPAIPLIMMAVSTAVAVGGAVMQGVAAKEQADTQAKIARQQALFARQTAEAEEKEYRDSTSRAMATRRALLGGSGVDPGSGSPLLAMEDFASEVELQALLYRQAGQAELTGGFIRGGSLLLSGAADAWGGGSSFGTKTVRILDE
jgi:hypothetical protein